MKRLIDITKKLNDNNLNLVSFNATLHPENENIQLELNTYLLIDWASYIYNTIDTDNESLDLMLDYLKKEHNLIKRHFKRPPKKTTFPTDLLCDLIQRLEQENINIDNPNVIVTFKDNWTIKINWNYFKNITYTYNNFDNAVNETIDYLKEKLN